MDSSSDATGASDFKPDVPDDLLNVARAAKESFDQGKYRMAEKQYRQILAKSPKNLYALSNLGVVYLRNGKFRSAESTLKKALTISSNDEFLRTTLGIVYYRQSKFDDALAELTSGSRDQSKERYRSQLSGYYREPERATARSRKGNTSGYRKQS